MEDTMRLLLLLTLIASYHDTFPDGFDVDARFGTCNVDVAGSFAFNGGTCGVCAPTHQGWRWLRWRHDLTAHERCR